MSFYKAEKLIEENNCTKAEFLDLGELGLTSIPEKLFELSHLKSLNLGWKYFENGKWETSKNEGNHNKIEEISKEIARLSQLEQISFDWNPIKDLKFLQVLPNLITLNISDTQIKDWSILQNYPSLKLLDLSYNQIQDISFLAGLKNLSELDLSSNQIQDISFLAGLKNLSSLDLSYNQIQDYSFLAGLNNLSSLYLSSNQIQDYSFLAGLNNLSSLDLSSNQIQDISFLAGLNNLSSLYLRDNQIQDISFLAGLNNLSSLDLSSNQIQDYSFLAGLNNLFELYLSYNKLNLFPIFILDNKNLSSLYLSYNPVGNLPLEILNQDNCLEDAKSWFQDLAKGKIKNYELKLIVIGNGRVGKTCTINRLLYNKYSDEEPSTHAIHIDKWEQPILWESSEGMGEEVTLTINVWDFGGQDIYHATHRWFMQSRALFLILWDLETEQNPLGEKDERASDYPFRNYKLTYWLDYVRSFSKNSPVIIAQNKIDKHNRQLPPNQSYLNNMYELTRYTQVSAKKNKGIGALKELILETYQETMTEVGMEMPLSWFNVRKELIALSEESFYISYKEYEEICKSQKVITSSIPSLLRYLHDSGNVFYQANLLKDKIILDQEWAIKAVYQIFNREGPFFELRKGDGSFKFSHLKFPLGEEYSIEERKMILSFMESCEICFRKERNKEEEDPIYIAPELLSIKKHEKIEDFWENNQEPALHLMYDHPILHKAFIQRFIVRTGHLASDDTMWQNGIHFRFQSSHATVESHQNDYGGSIYIRTTGHQKLELLQLIKKEFQDIYHYKNIEIKTLVSLDGKCFVELKKLKEEADLNNPTVKAIDGSDVSIHDLMDFLRESKEIEEEHTEKRLKDYYPPPDQKEREDKRIKVFLSYALADELARQKLRENLKVLERTQSIKVFDQFDLKPGEDTNKILHQVWPKQADIIILLLSNRFIANDDCFDKQLPDALKKWENGTVKLVPILLDKITNFDRLAISKLTSLPKNSVPINKWENQEDAWIEIAEELNKVIRDMEEQ